MHAAVRIHVRTRVGALTFMLILQCNIICHSFPLQARVVSRVKSNVSSCMPLRNIIMTGRVQDIGPTTSRHHYIGLSICR